MPIKVAKLNRRMLVGPGEAAFSSAAEGRNPHLSKRRERKGDVTQRDLTVRHGQVLDSAASSNGLKSIAVALKEEDRRRHGFDIHPIGSHALSSRDENHPAHVDAGIDAEVPSS